MPESKYAYLGTPDPEYEELFAKIPHREPSNDIEIVRGHVEKYFVSISREHFRPHLPPGMCAPVSYP
jgi:hypothetical protein